MRMHRIPQSALAARLASMPAKGIDAWIKSQIDAGNLRGQCSDKGAGPARYAPAYVGGEHADLGAGGSDTFTVQPQVAMILTSVCMQAAWDVADTGWPCNEGIRCTAASVAQGESFLVQGTGVTTPAICGSIFAPDTPWGGMPVGAQYVDGSVPFEMTLINDTGRAATVLSGGWGYYIAGDATKLRNECGKQAQTFWLGGTRQALAAAGTATVNTNPRNDFRVSALVIDVCTTSATAATPTDNSVQVDDLSYAGDPLLREASAAYGIPTSLFRWAQGGGRLSLSNGDPIIMRPTSAASLSMDLENFGATAVSVCSTGIGVKV